MKETFLSQMTNSRIYEFADALLKGQGLPEELTEEELKVIGFLAESRRKVLSIEDPLTVSVISAMWGEQNRLRQKSEDNPNGEDALRVKIDSLRWLTEGSKVSWKLYMVDDGCPNNSGQIAEEISKQVGDERVKILYLQEGIDNKDESISGLNDVDDSKKGGAIRYGASVAVREGCDAIVYTDADNSVNLAQIGNMIEKLSQGEDYVIGNRKHPDSILKKDNARFGQGTLAVRQIQRMLAPEIYIEREIKDTQAPLKLIRSSLVHPLIKATSNFDFSFDTDFLLAAISNGTTISDVPMIFEDSLAESATAAQGGNATWYRLLSGLAKSVEKFIRDMSPERKKLLALVNRLTPDYVGKILEHELPEQLKGKTDNEVGSPTVMNVDEIEQWLEKEIF